MLVETKAVARRIAAGRIPASIASELGVPTVSVVNVMARAGWQAALAEANAERAARQARGDAA